MPAIKQIDIQKNINVPKGAGGLVFNPLLAVSGIQTLLASGWTSVNWTGSWAAGWTHTPGNVSALSQSAAAVIGTKYAVSWGVTGWTAGTFSLSFGGEVITGLSATGSFNPTASTVAGLIVTPTSDFDGTILLSVVSAGVALVAPDLVIAVPKETGNSSASVLALAVGNQQILQSDAGSDHPYDVMSIAFHTVQKVQTGNEKHVYLSAATSIAAAGTALDPTLKEGGVLVAPDICIPVPKVVPSAATKMPYVPTVLATGNITVWSGEVGAINNDICMLRMHTIQRLTAQVFGGNQARQRYFTIANGISALTGDTYYNAADATQIFTVTRTKVSGDGVLTLQCLQTAGVAGPGASGTLNVLLAAIGSSATIGWTAVLYEKYADLKQNVSVDNVTGLVFDPGIVVHGVHVMPDIVIPIPKAAATVPYVPTDLAGAAGNVTVKINGAGPINCDILSLKVVTGFRGFNSRYFTIANGLSAAVGDIYVNAADATQLFQVTIAKVSGDGVLSLTCIQTAGAAGPAGTGTLNAVTTAAGSSAAIAWTAVSCG